ncbi:MAG: SUMF1/EgtB/PvdO family nonheme iron enzyme [Tahibacter sp.]
MRRFDSACSTQKPLLYFFACALIALLASFVVPVANVTAAAASTVAGTTLRDCGECPQLVVVPAGTFVMGSADGEWGHQKDEGPRRTIAFAQPLAVGRTEVTRGEYEAFVHATGRAVSGDCVTDRRKAGTWEADSTTTFRDPGFAQTDRHPVVCVSHDDAVAYIAWLNTRTHGGYRLPSEAEWEYVAHAGATTTFAWGNDANGGCHFMNGFDATAMKKYRDIDVSQYPVFDPLACNDGVLNTAPVGTFQPNRFGVYETMGNVGEWIADCYTDSHAAQPADGSAIVNPAAPCANPMSKGGSWGSLAHNQRPAERFKQEPTLRDDSIGIRVVRTLQADPKN